MLEVRDPGFLSTVQDAGRPGYGRLGVPPSGACDPWGLAVANLVCGNDEGAAALEITVGGPALTVREACVVALGGADLRAVVVEEGRRLAVGSAHPLRPGTTLRFEGAAGAGARGYLALPGGIDVPEVLGSRSTCLVGGFGGVGGALRTGDTLRPGRPGDLAAAGRRWPGQTRLGDGPIRIVAGPHVEWFERGALEALAAAGWTVLPASDRQGVRLDGPPLPRRADPRDLVSEPVAWGAVQVPPDGGPIVLLADHNTIGGYPVLAVVARADRPALGQLGLGAAVRFTVVNVEEAQRAYREQRAVLRQAAGALGPRASADGPWEDLWRSAGG